MFAANKAIADPAAAVQFKLYHRRKDGDREEITEHELLDLLNGPNLAHTGEQLRQLHYTYMKLTGESYILMLKGSGEYTPKRSQLPEALQILPTHRIPFKVGKKSSESYKAPQRQHPTVDRLAHTGTPFDKPAAIGTPLDLNHPGSTGGSELTRETESHACTPEVRPGDP